MDAHTADEALDRCDVLGGLEHQSHRRHSDAFGFIAEFMKSESAETGLNRWVVLGLSISLLAAGCLLWCLIVQTRKTESVITLLNQGNQQFADFVVYRAYRDAELDIARQVVTFTSSNLWEKSIQVGGRKVMEEPAPTRSQNAIAEWSSVYNWHKSRAIYRRLQRSAPAAAAPFLDGLERVGILTHSEILAVGNTNVIDPY